MASAFWTLEDGRTFAIRHRAMAFMLDRITAELKLMDGAGKFYIYLERLVCREENGDISNGYGGFIRGDESIMFNFDLREFTPVNREYFWKAAQKVMNDLFTSETDEAAIFIFKELLDMHKRIQKGEDPALLNHLRMILPPTNKKAGPGW